MTFMVVQSKIGALLFSIVTVKAEPNMADQGA